MRSAICRGQGEFFNADAGAVHQQAKSLVGRTGGDNGLVLKGQGYGSGAKDIEAKTVSRLPTGLASGAQFAFKNHLSIGIDRDMRDFPHESGQGQGFPVGEICGQGHVVRCQGAGFGGFGRGAFGHDFGAFDRLRRRCGSGR